MKRCPLFLLRNASPSPREEHKELFIFTRERVLSKKQRLPLRGRNGSRRLNTFTFKREIDTVPGGEGVAVRAVRRGRARVRNAVRKGRGDKEIREEIQS